MCKTHPCHLSTSTTPWHPGATRHCHAPLGWLRVGGDAPNICKGPEHEARGGAGFVLTPQHHCRDPQETMEQRETAGSLAPW